MTLPKFKKIMKSNKGFSIISGLTVSYSKPLCLFFFQNYSLSVFISHINTTGCRQKHTTHMHSKPLIQIKKRLMCILTPFIFLIFIAARLSNSFVHESAFMPVLMMAADGVGSAN